LGLGIPVLAAESPYCAFEVKVMKPSGAPNPNIPVMMAVRGKQAFEKKSDANGLVRICDAPLEHVDIAAGFDVCGLVTVKDVTPEWLATVKVFITFEDHPCDHWGYQRDCHILWRVQDEGSHPVVGAHFESNPPRAGAESDFSDDVGRLFQFINRDGTLQGLLLKKGYKPVQLAEQCGPGQDVNRELKVVMHKQSP
jgi:hypothetical protein